MFKKYTWHWEASDLTNTFRSNEILKFCFKKNVEIIYLQFSKNVDFIYYRMFIEKATSLGIKIHALMGEREWYKTDNYFYIKERLDLIKKYNDESSANQLFTGIHFDIEPHTLPEWKSNQGDVLNQWANVIDTYRNDIAYSLDIETSASVPFSISKVPYNYAFFSQYMMDKHDKIAIMAYRDFADGNDSICYHSQSFIDQAWKKSSIIVGVETKPNMDPPKQTFAEEGELEMYNQLEKVNVKFNSYLTYDAIAIHSIKHWMDMKK